MSAYAEWVAYGYVLLGTLVLIVVCVAVGLLRGDE